SSSGSTSTAGTSTASSSSTPSTGSTTRIEETDPSIVYTGSWYKDSNGVFSGGSATGGIDAGDRSTLTFSGTGVNLIGYEDQWSGIANIFLDGKQVGQVDTYSSGQKAQTSLYSVSGLAAGTHTLAVEVTGTKNANSSGSWVWVDAFVLTA